MILYHYTSKENLEGILSTGLSRGEAPLNDDKVVNAVNLTSDPTPWGHGLDGGGRRVTHEESAKYLSLKGWHIPAGTLIVNKRELRLTVKVHSVDRNLKRWRSWSRKHCDPGFPEQLEEAAGQGGRKAKGWWLYFGIIPRDAITAVEELDAAGLPIGPFPA